MTKEEAIDYIIPAIKNYWNDKICDNIIKALAQEPCKVESECINENRNNK